MNSNKYQKKFFYIGNAYLSILTIGLMFYPYSNTQTQLTKSTKVKLIDMKKSPTWAPLEHYVSQKIQIHFHLHAYHHVTLE